MSRGLTMGVSNHLTCEALMASDKVFTTKLGTTRAGERSRIWIEGKRLTAHGFTPGVVFVKQWSEGKLALVADLALVDAAPSKDCGTVSGKGDKPIIDITGTLVRDTFGMGSHVTVTYRASRITITRGA